MIVVSDTSPITSLAVIGQLDLLRQLYSKILIPEAVYLELTGTQTPVLGSNEVNTLEWIEVRQVTNRSLVPQGGSQKSKVKSIIYQGFCLFEMGGLFPPCCTSRNLIRATIG